VLSDGEVADDVVVALLGVGQGETGVDVQGLAGGVAAVGLDERVVDALGLEPCEQEVAEGVRADRGGDARGLGVPGEDLADAAVGVGLLPARLAGGGTSRTTARVLPRPLPAAPTRTP
jgi:hypothetical protein